jgi:hypothetical protein
VEQEAVSKTGSRRDVRRWLPASVAAVVLIGAIGTTAWATIPSSSTGVIHSCYNTTGNPSGALRVINADIGAKCAKNETALDFNQTGPPGPKGDQGIQGIQGPKGDPGNPGTNGVNGTNGTNGTNGVNGTSTVYQAVNGVDAGALSISVPAGKYFVVAQAAVYNSDFEDPQDAICSLQGEVVAWYDRLDEGLQVTLPITGVVVLASPGNITIDCGGFNINAQQKRLYVVPVTTIIG